jgi:hypothetical protein
VATALNECSSLNKKRVSPHTLRHTELYLKRRCDLF